MSRSVSCEYISTAKTSSFTYYNWSTASASSTQKLIDDVSLITFTFCPVMMILDPTLIWNARKPKLLLPFSSWSLVFVSVQIHPRCFLQSLHSRTIKWNPWVRGNISSDTRHDPCNWCNIKKKQETLGWKWCQRASYESLNKHKKTILNCI